MQFLELWYGSSANNSIMEKLKLMMKREKWRFVCNNGNAGFYTSSKNSWMIT